jgi:hypothetical protein
LYGEFYKENDYIEISRDGVKFRETPTFGVGWLPINQQIPFDEIRIADMVEVSSTFSPKKKRLAILLWPKNKKQIIIGSQLSKDQLVKISLALKGTVVLSKSLEKILGLDLGAKFSDVVDGARNIWEKYQDQRSSKNG